MIQRRLDGGKRTRVSDTGLPVSLPRLWQHPTSAHWVSVFVPGSMRAVESRPPNPLSAVQKVGWQRQCSMRPFGHVRTMTQRRQPNLTRQTMSIASIHGATMFLRGECKIKSTLPPYLGETPYESLVRAERRREPGGLQTLHQDQRTLRFARCRPPTAQKNKSNAAGQMAKRGCLSIIFIFFVLDKSVEKGVQEQRAQVQLPLAAEDRGRKLAS